MTLSAWQREFDQGVSDVVGRQQRAGVDVVNDGEQGRSQYATYVKERLTGFEGERMIRARPRLDEADFPEFAATQTHYSSPQPPSASLHRTNSLEGLACGFAGH